MIRKRALLLLLAPAACTPAVDERLRRIDLLDRVFEPERFRAPPAAPSAVTPPVVAPPIVATPVVAEPVSEPITAGPLDPLPPTDPVTEPRPAAPADPVLRQRALLRQQPWLSRFWSALSPAQQRRVQRRLPVGADPAGAWDSMGLADRVTLVFGAGG